MVDETWALVISLFLSLSLSLFLFFLAHWDVSISAESSGAVEYTDSLFAEECDPPNECREYDNKRFDGKAAVQEIWEIIAITPGSTLTRSDINVRITSVGQIELFEYLTVYKQMTDSKLKC